MKAKANEQYQSLGSTQVIQRKGIKMAGRHHSLTDVDSHIQSFLYAIIIIDLKSMYTFRTKRVVRSRRTNRSQEKDSSLLGMRWVRQ